MKNIRFINIKIILLLFVLSSGIIIGVFSFQRSTILTRNEKEVIFNNTKSAMSWELDSITIDNNWSITASTYDWCSGAGTIDYPYVIENVTINAGIKIQNTVENFTIRNCTMNYSMIGIHLINCTNGVIDNNTFWFHFDGAIYLDDCNHVVISNNKISQSYYGIRSKDGSFNTISSNQIFDGFYGIYIDGANSFKYTIIGNQLINNAPGIYLFGKAHEVYNNTFEDFGIVITQSSKELASSYTIDASNTLNNKPIYYYANRTNLSRANFTNAGQIILANCNNSEVSDFSFSNTGLPILMAWCCYNEISNITIKDEVYGICMVGSDFNTIYDNEIDQCGIGIWSLWEDNNNSLIDNLIVNSTSFGIRLDDDDNLFVNNTFKDNQNCGLFMSEYSHDNLVYRNSFINNVEHAIDDGVNNYWNNSYIGNYWDDYIGDDLNEDGIGDIPYIISGSAGSQDNYPIFIIRPPSIQINAPLNNSLFGTSAPNYDVTITGSALNTSWYTLDGGTTNITFTQLTGIIDQGEWDKISNGPAVIFFYANNSQGLIGVSKIQIYKDIDAPLIDIILPTESQLWRNPPEFDLNITESNIDSIWYTINGGSELIVNLESGIIDQAYWNSVPDGNVNITFYANDTAGNLGFKSINVTKDTTAPLININQPSGGAIFRLVPNYNITVYEENLEIWYTIDDGTHNYTIDVLTGVISESAWGSLPDGYVSLKFYAKDEAGNVGFTEIQIIKDTTAPIITINQPETGVIFNGLPPIYNISIDEANLESYWYSLDGGITNINITSFSGEISESAWKALPNGHVTITFYARDKGGNIGENSVTITKNVDESTPPPEIPGYDLYLMIGVISVISTLIVRKHLNSQSYQ